MKVNIFCLPKRWFRSDYFLTLCIREFHRFLRKNLKKIVKNHVCCVLFCFVFFFWAYFGLSSWLRNRLMQVQPHVRNRQWYQNVAKLIETFGQKIILFLVKWPKNSVIELSVSLKKYLSMLTYLRAKIKKICAI